MIINNEPVATAGVPLKNAQKVLIMVHGRGDSAQNFIRFAEELDLSDFSILAPQAIQNTWYPYSFLSPLEKNEPQLSLSLGGLSEILDDLKGLQIKTQNIFFIGFSQGACLSLEFCARNADHYGGIIAFTGGLLGDTVDISNYKGDFQGTPIFIGASDHDPHVPEKRIDESEVILSQMNANVIKKIYPGMGHTINHDEIKKANTILNQD